MDDRNTQKRLLPDMGIKDSSSETDPLSNQYIDSVLNLLFDDFNLETNCQTPVPVPVEKSLTNFFIEEKRNYFLKVSSRIRETKEKFLRHYNLLLKNIEFMSQQITLCAATREMQLKAKLGKIGGEKIAKWNQQMLLCEEAVKLLKRCEFGSCSTGSIFPDSIWNDDLTKQLDFIDAGEIEFDNESIANFLKTLQSLGNLRCPNGTSMVDPSAYGYRSLTPKFIFGGNGCQPGEFCRPWGVCSDAVGRILVCDRSNHRIQIFNELGDFSLQFGREGSKPGEFNRPSGIDVDNKCRILVADKDNHRVQIFTFSGHYLFEFGTMGTRPGEFMYPWDVAANKNCDIAVSDTKNHRVQIFNEAGVLISIFDSKTMGCCNPRTALKFLDSPRGLAFTPEGKLLVTDFNNHRVLIINESFSRATLLGCEGSGSSQFFRPQGIACDKNGRFAVADCKNYRIQVFDPQGHMVLSFGSQGSDLGQFDCPHGISFHPNGNIIVVDFNNNRVQVF